MGEIIASFIVQVTDFGLSYMRSLPGCDDSNMHQKCGTLYYMGEEEEEEED